MGTNEKCAIQSVLLVDDNEADNQYHSIIIEDTGLVDTISVALNGRQALEIIESSAHSSKEPDLIFLDLNMPVMDGFEFIEAFRALRKRLHVKSADIVMLTTSMMDEDRQRALTYSELGGFLNKPLTDDGFREIVKGFLER